MGVVIGGIGEGKNQRYEVLDIKGVVRLIPVQAENTIPRLKPEDRGRLEAISKLVVEKEKTQREIKVLQDKSNKIDSQIIKNIQEISKEKKQGVPDMDVREFAEVIKRKLTKEQRAKLRGYTITGSTWSNVSQIDIRREEIIQKHDGIHVPRYVKTDTGNGSLYIDRADTDYKYDLELYDKEGYNLELNPSLDSKLLYRSGSEIILADTDTILYEEEFSIRFRPGVAKTEELAHLIVKGLRITKR